MKPTSFFLLTAGASAVTALPKKPCTRDDQPKCENPEQRKSWHDITDDERKAYTSAAKCLLTSPQKLNKLPGAKTRYYLKTLEFLLRECGYEGVLPYWDETRDAGSFSSSVIFDPETGFGGGGAAQGGCVPDGPFYNLTVNIGPGFGSEPRCVNRKFTDFFSDQTGTTYVEAALNATDYAGVLPGIYAGPHLYGHMSLAMMDGNSITSSGDPLFFMHHGFVDKMWAQWQAQDPENRLKDISGLNAQDPDVGFSEFPGGMEEESKMWGHPSEELLAVTPDPQAGDDGPEITLNHIMSSLGIIPDATVADVMDTTGGYLCYEYV